MGESGNLEDKFISAVTKGASDLNKRLRNLRLKKGMTQKELADKLHVSDKTISKWEAGLSCPDVITCLVISKLLDTDIYYLIEGENSDSITISQLERCARKDDVSLLDGADLNSKDDFGTSLRTFIHRYGSVNLAVHFMSKGDLSILFSYSKNNLPFGRLLIYKPEVEDKEYYLDIALLAALVSKNKENELLNRYPIGNNPSGTDGNLPPLPFREILLESDFQHFVFDPVKERGNFDSILADVDGWKLMLDALVSGFNALTTDQKKYWYGSRDAFEHSKNPGFIALLPYLLEDGRRYNHPAFLRALESMELSRSPYEPLPETLKHLAMMKDRVEFERVNALMAHGWTSGEYDFWSGKDISDRELVTPQELYDLKDSKKRKSIFLPRRYR